MKASTVDSDISSFYKERAYHDIRTKVQMLRGQTVNTQHQKLQITLSIHALLLFRQNQILLEWDWIRGRSLLLTLFNFIPYLSYAWHIMSSVDWARLCFCLDSCNKAHGSGSCSWLKAWAKLLRARLLPACRVLSHSNCHSKALYIALIPQQSTGATLAAAFSDSLSSLVKSISYSSL